MGNSFSKKNILSNTDAFMKLVTSIYILKTFQQEGMLNRQYAGD